MDARQDWGASTAITINLNSLANNSARESAAIDNTSDEFPDALVTVQVKTNSNVPTGDKAVYVYVAGSEDGTNFTDNATGSDAGITLASPTNLIHVATIACPALSTTYRKVFSVATAFGGQGNMPRKWSVIVQNKTGNALDSTGHAVTYSGVFQKGV